MKRILLKLSGEALAGAEKKGFDEATVIAVAKQIRAVAAELGLDPEKTNPNGGAMALGHPQGATGAFLTCKALDELKRTNGKYGLVTMCIGGGMGAAGVYKMCENH